MFIDKEDITTLKKIGESKGLSVASIVRMLIKEYIDRHRSSSRA